MLGYRRANLIVPFYLPEAVKQALLGGLPADEISSINALVLGVDIRDLACYDSDRMHRDVKDRRNSLDACSLSVPAFFYGHSPLSTHP